MNTSISYQEVAVQSIRMTSINPRSQTDPDALEGLAASMGEEKDDRLVQPLILREMPDGLELICGERRLAGALRRGYKKVPALIRRNVSNVEAFRLRAVENLHREELHPLDLAKLLKAEWHVDNLEARGHHAHVENAMQAASDIRDLLFRLNALLEADNFKKTKPDVKWDQTLNRLGIALSRDARKRLLRMLTVPEDLHEDIKELNLSDAQIRSLGLLAASEQKALLREVKATPHIKHNIRYICRSVLDGTNDFEQALLISRGGKAPAYNDYEASEERRFSAGMDAPVSISADAADADSDMIASPIISILEAAQELQGAMTPLMQAVTYDSLPPYWQQCLRTGLDLVEQVIESAKPWVQADVAAEPEKAKKKK